MKRVRFAPSPTGSLHVGNALSAVANRRLGDWMLLRIDDTDPARNVPGGEAELIQDLRWLGIDWDEGPVRQSERQERYREAAEPLGDRFDGTTLLREDGTATYQLASVVDDVDFGITHVLRGNDHRPNEPLQRRLFAALGAPAPEFVHHGLVLGPDEKKLSKRSPGARPGRGAGVRRARPALSGGPAGEGRAGDPGALSRARAGRARRKGDRPRAEGGRRRPALAPPRADRPRARARAVGGDRRPPA